MDFREGVTGVALEAREIEREGEAERKERRPRKEVGAGRKEEDLWVLGVVRAFVWMHI